MQLPLVAVHVAQARIENVQIVREPAWLIVMKLVIALREVPNHAAQPGLFDGREGVPFGDNPVEHMADTLGQFNIDVRSLQAQALHIFEMRVGRLQQQFGWDQLPVAHVLFELCELIGLEPVRAMGWSTTVDIPSDTSRRLRAVSDWDWSRRSGE